jgi:hypothetical protein
MKCLQEVEMEEEQLIWKSIIMQQLRVSMRTEWTSVQTVEEHSCLIDSLSISDLVTKHMGRLTSLLLEGEWLEVEWVVEVEVEWGVEEWAVVEECQVVDN